MKLKELYVKNFGCYEEEIFQIPHIMVMLKENAQGKTTFLQALNFALCGNYQERMMRKGCTEMEVSLTFQDGFCVKRRRKSGVTSSAMGDNKKPTFQSKEIVDAAVIQHCGSKKMEFVKVIASSKELFEMKADSLAKFLMDNIPNVLSIEDVLSYIEDITPQMETEIRRILPASGEFGQESILNAYRCFDETRKELAKTLKIEKAKIDGYDFSKKYRSPDMIKEEYNRVLAELGSLNEKKKLQVHYEQQNQVRQKQLEKLRDLKERFNAIQATCPNEEYFEELIRNETTQRQFESSLQSDIATYSQQIFQLHEIIASLKKGLCPQIKDMRCPNNWRPVIHKLQTQCESLQKKLTEKQTALGNCKKELDNLSNKKQAYMSNKERALKKQALFQEFTSLKQNLTARPPEIEFIDTQALTGQKKKLESELQESMKFQSMSEIQASIPEKEIKLARFESLTKDFSSKGIVMEKNLKNYFRFFTDSINPMAQSFGYQLQLDFDKGIRILASKQGNEPVPLEFCSTGERTVIIFMLLSFLNSLTGLNILFLDDIECLDKKVMENLLKLIHDNQDHYDHVIISGVDHEDTTSLVSSYL